MSTPPTALTIKEEGNRLFQAKNYEAAAEKYREAIDVDSSNPTFYSNLCNCLSKLRNYEDMEPAARSCIDLDVSFIKGYYWLALSFQHQERYKEALQAVENGLKVDNSNLAIQDLRRDIQERLDNKSRDPLAEYLMESCELGQTVFVSKGISTPKFIPTDDAGIFTLNLDAPRLGSCAYSECDSNVESQKLSRCARCWQVDYCSREHQKLDWKRHKEHECEKRKEYAEHKVKAKGNDGKDTTRSTTKLGWQALTYEANNAMKKKNYAKAIDFFTQAIGYNRGSTFATAPVMLKLSLCHLECGNAQKALVCAYSACQRSHGDLMSLVVKAKCHIELNDVEAAYYTCYSAFNSHLLSAIKAKNREKGTSLERNHVLPLLQDVTKTLVDHIVKMKSPLSESSFPMKLHLASVPFTMDYKHGQVGLIQDFMGDGFHLYQPQKTYSSIPTIQDHTTVTYGSRLVIFGGNEGANGVTNCVRTFEVDESSTNKYIHHLQTCTGDAPPPSQGHTACVLGSNMYCFGGSAPCSDMYVLDLKEWEWTKLDSLCQTPEEDQPDADILFSSIVPFNDHSLLLIGGMKGEAMRNTTGGAYGVMGLSDRVDPVSANMHLYSLKTGQWKRIMCNGNDAPRGWKHQVHNIGENEVLLLCGQSDTLADNSLHILKKTSNDTNARLEWSRIEEDMSGIPPSQSTHRATTWIASAKSLMLYGGKYQHFVIKDSVWKSRDTEGDVTSFLQYDTELYCFNLASKHWIRLRVPENSRARNSHTMNEVDGKLIVVGGCVVASGTKGYMDEREYVTDVTCYDLDLLNQTMLSEIPITKQTKSDKKKKGKGKREGKKRK